ncbi:carboxypeptidase regulatory-like domain-containing protein [Sphingomonas cavernae]|uniref:Carboxypeptidase regulatory-like domain-containing protein n=1 Tax=Sphingomonas cavernae TaxID=2320861 RepID=A0A418WRB6_9SPHN|nr:carboxypeptidase regulatory-like domain-containing protein [Sphingomonas cavernae]
MFKRLAAWGAAICAALLTPSAYAQAAWAPNDDDALLLDLRLGRLSLGDGVRGYRTPEGVCVDLADVILALDLPMRLDKPARRASGWAFDERNQITVDRAQNSVQIGANVEKLDEAAIRDVPDGWCIAVKPLSRWIGVEFIPDLGNALLLVKSTARLPVELAAERRARAAAIPPQRGFDLKAMPKADAPFRLWRTPSVDVVATLAAIEDKRTGSRFDATYELYVAGEVGKASFDARLASDQNGVPANLRLRAYRTDPDGGLLGALGATHFALGDVAGLSTPLVAQSAVGRGAVVTNRPIDRPDSFDRTDFHGELPMGWDAELYRNGQLLAFANDRADGRYAFLSVPLLYGQNRFEVVLYGPQGQVRREERLVAVGVDSIPPRETWYWAGINEANTDLIMLKDYRDPRNRGWRGSVGLERGIDTYTSTGAQLHSLVLEDVRHNYAEAFVRRAIGPALVEVSGAYEDTGGYALRAQMLGQFGRSYLTVESVLAHDYRSDRIEPGVTGWHGIALDHSLNVGRTILPVHLEARYETRARSIDTLELAARASANVSGLVLTGQLDYRADMVPTGPDPPARIEASLLANARLGRVRLRGETRFRLSRGAGLETATVVGEWAAGERADWRAELGYDRSYDRARLGFGYSRRFDRFAVTASVEGASDGSVAAGFNLAFAFGPDPRGRGIRMSATKLASHGQVFARVWRDSNNDGVRQRSEPLEREVQLAAGQIAVERLTDSQGSTVIDGLVPFRPVLIGIDAASLPDPLVQPASPGVVVTPRPGIAIAIELPLSSAGEIHGTLVRGGGGAIEGVDLELVDDEGRVLRVTRTEFDGYFLFEGVPYGRYAIRIAQISADAARLRAALGLSVVVGEARPSVALGTIAAEASASRSAEALR